MGFLDGILTQKVEVGEKQWKSEGEDVHAYNSNLNLSVIEELE